MKMDENKPSRVTSRADKVGQKRKANRVYNILLGIVIVAIVVVLVTIFSGNDDDNQATSVEESRKQQQETKNIEEAEEEEESAEQSDNVNEQNEAIVEDEDSTGNNDESDLDEPVEDGNWQPVGTTQTGEHVTDFTKGSTDWNEMEKALAYGAGIDHSNMTVYWLGNGGAPNKAVGTVAPKDNSAQYRVHIEWVDGGGWRPYQVERIK